MRANNRIWDHKAIPTLDLTLDPSNARLDLKPSSSQDEIRRALVETEDIEKLAKSIAKTGGRMAGERLVVVEEKGKFIVMEGNRRTCACQLLLDQRVKPKGLTLSIPAIDAITKGAIQNLFADIAPSREEADIIVTRRHTESGIKPWSTLANIRRVVRLIGAGKTEKEISDDTGISAGRLRQLLQASAVIDKVLSLGCWSSSEKSALSNPNLKTNAFTRFFTLQGVKSDMGIEFKPDNSIKISKDKAATELALEFIARELLIPDPATGKTKGNTRTEPSELFVRMNKWNGGTNILGIKVKKNKNPQLGKFFDGLVCSCGDRRCSIITKEIASINYKVNALAASFLVRALFEGSLMFAIKKSNLIKKLNTDYAQQNPRNPGNEPGLDYLIKFSEQNWQQIFEKNPSRPFAAMRAQKNWADLVIHGKWMEAHPSHLEAASASCFALLQGILDESYLK